MADLIHVRAVDALSVSFVAPDGAILKGRYVARDFQGEPLADGERVPAIAHYTRAVQRGELALVTPDADRAAIGGDA